MAKKKAKRKPQRKPTKKTTADVANVTAKPKDWDKAISVAYLRMLGASQAESAAQAGVSTRTVTAWEASPWWPKAIAEARQRWLSGCDQLAMKGIKQAFTDPDEYAKHSRWYADRRIPELAPPTTKTELTGAEGIPLTTQIVFVAPDDSDK